MIDFPFSSNKERFQTEEYETWKEFNIALVCTFLFLYSEDLKGFISDLHGGRPKTNKLFNFNATNCI